ncbi:MAG: Flp pilus assembly complex ATPase component TadA [Thermoplasmata archaeon]|nr:Flp pilus assembly complex ATPase component TadA [Thermoplasmata archaeon]MBE3136856.1 Flp pilus assembly complex ATPase component TadA [Thermoplasmata archaeon]
MEKQHIRKKVPLRSSQPDDDSEIEKKVDEILNAHSEVLDSEKESKELSKNPLQVKSKRPSLFFINSKKKTKPEKQAENEINSAKKHPLILLLRNTRLKTKNSWESPQKHVKKDLINTRKDTSLPPRTTINQKMTSIKQKILRSPSQAENPHFRVRKPPKKSEKKTMPVVKQVEKEKKPAPLKTKKRIGFRKRKKEGETAEFKPDEKKKLTKTKEELPQFEESIAQVKPDEATWLDQKIKAGKTGEDESKPGTAASKKVEVVMLDDDVKTVQPNRDKKEPQGIQAGENVLGIDMNNAALDEKSRIDGLFQKSAFDTPGQAPDPKKIKLDEITPDGIIQFPNEANTLKTVTLERMGYSRDAIEEIDFYPLHEPFAYVEIIREKESLDKRYVLLEMKLSEEDAHLLKFVQETLEGFAFKTADLEAKGGDKYLTEKVDLIIDEYMLNIDTLTKKKILYYLKKESIGLGKLEVLMKDPNIEDISCDGSGVFLFLYHRRYGSLKSNIQFDDEDQLTAFVVKLAQKCGKHISISEPMLDATMPDGSRIQMTLSTEVTTKGSTFTIRKFSEDPFSPPDLIEFHTMSSEMVAYMWLAVENGVNALIAGGTAAGKTSTLNALCLFIPRESKIVSIEETREINLPHPNWIPGVVRSGFGDVVGNKVIGEIDLYDLMKAALRQRPEYILVGEIRGKEAYVLFQAMATGHTTYSTVHADSAQSLIHRLEGKPIEIPRIMLQTLDIVCIQVISRVKNKRARRCKQIIEIIDIDPTTKEILTNEVFRWDPIEDKFIYSGKSYILERIRAEKDISREGMIGEIKNRTTLLDWMNKNNIREFKKVATVVAQYADNPADVMKKIKNEL